MWEVFLNFLVACDHWIFPWWFLQVSFLSSKQCLSLWDMKATATLTVPMLPWFLPHWFHTYEHVSIPRSLLHQTRKNAQRNAKRLPDEGVGWRWRGSALLWERSMQIPNWNSLVWQEIYQFLSNRNDLQMLGMLPSVALWWSSRNRIFLWDYAPIPLGSKGSFHPIQIDLIPATFQTMPTTEPWTMNLDVKPSLQR